MGYDFPRISRQRQIAVEGRYVISECYPTLGQTAVFMRNYCRINFLKCTLCEEE
jgi:hypothetical protein